MIDPHHPTEQEARAIDVHELLPQQVPFVMVSQLVHFDMVRTITELHVSGDNIFVEDGRLSATGLVEHIAQTCAARIGYINKYILLKGIQIGVIGAIRDLTIHRLPLVDETVTTTLDVLQDIFGMTLIQAMVTMGDETLATTQMKIAVKE
jgi:predicted hotdog family 3-hydroxylacyl-ACP dehydratase